MRLCYGDDCYYESPPMPMSSAMSYISILSPPACIFVNALRHVALPFCRAISYGHLF